MDWFPDWSKYIGIVIAGGPSVTKEDIEAVKDLSKRDLARVMVINSTYKLVHWADALYATDFKWWKHYNGAPDFSGIRICCGLKGVEKLYPNVYTVRVPVKEDSRRSQIVFEPKGLVGTGGNSGFQGLNLVIQFGCKRILLLGFDFSLDGGTHHHGDHPKPLHNPDAPILKKWRDKLDAQAFRINGNGIRVINCSASSTLENFPKMKVKDAVAHWNADTP